MPLQQDRCLFYVERQVQPSETFKHSNPIQGLNQFNTVGPAGKFVGFFPISKQTPTFSKLSVQGVLPPTKLKFDYLNR